MVEDAMDNLLPFIPLALSVLACPLMMASMGVGVWLWTRAAGKKKGLSMSCMGGHAEQHQQPVAQAEEGKLREKVARLERELQALRAQVQASADGSVPTDARVSSEKEPLIVAARSSEEDQT
jgi:outer membrane murein-binding lipoprotein Lpp